jgi:hypothetical protein
MDEDCGDQTNSEDQQELSLNQSTKGKQTIKIK